MYRFIIVIQDTNFSFVFSPFIGFYTARKWNQLSILNLSIILIYVLEQSVISGILAEVKSLKSKFSGYYVKCTGHSLGAALAQLTAMALKDNNIQVATLYNFGQPLVGDQNYASCANTYVATERVTHLKDTVPHIPFESWGYAHACREAYESSSTSTNPKV